VVDEHNLHEKFRPLKSTLLRPRQLELFPDQGNDQVRKFEDRLSALGGWLMWLPDCPDADAGTRLFHALCDRLHRAEVLKSRGKLTAMEAALHRTGKRLRRPA
jgi:hypothetical protein